MLTPEELRKQKAEAIGKAQAIKDAAKAQERDVTAEEMESVKGFLDEAEKLEAQAKEIEDKVTLDARLQAAQTDLKTPRPRIIPDAATPPPGEALDVQVGEDRFALDPKKNFRDYGEFCHAVADWSKGVRQDERLSKIRAAQGQNTLVGAEGGFLIPTEFINALFKRMIDVLPIMQQCMIIGMNTNSVDLTAVQDKDRSSTTYRHGGVVVYWVQEAGQITRSALKFRMINLKLNDVAALSYATEQQLRYTTNLGQMLLKTHGEAMSEEINEQIFWGTGSGKPLGCFNSPACVEQAKESGQAADTVVRENVSKIWSVIYSKSKGKGAWYYNGEIYPDLEVMEMPVGTGGVPIFIPAGGFSATPFNTIKGRPAYETDHMAALGDAGDIGFADMSDYLLGMASNSPDTAMSVHLRFDYAETAFRSMFAIDGKPWWDTTLRPRKGATARRVSPWVKLAERA